MLIVSPLQIIAETAGEMPVGWRDKLTVNLQRGVDDARLVCFSNADGPKPVGPRLQDWVDGLTTALSVGEVESFLFDISHPGPGALIDVGRCGGAAIDGLILRRQFLNAISCMLKDKPNITWATLAWSRHHGNNKGWIATGDEIFLSRMRDRRSVGLPLTAGGLGWEKDVNFLGVRLTFSSGHQKTALRRMIAENTSPEASC